MISLRTKAALKVAKDRDIQFGVNSRVLAIKHHNDAVEFAKQTLAGVHTTNRSYSSIARELNELGLLTFKGERFYPQTVKNMIGYLGIRK